ncbi:hypothetical protein BH11PSE13_BH11PSE13_33550 [soil metagenome]
MSRSSSMWFKVVAVGSLTVAGVMASSLANAGTQWSVGINLPGVVVGEPSYGPAPVYESNHYESAPVYSRPAPVAAPIYYDAQPVRVRPPETVYYAPPAPVYNRPPPPRVYGPSPVDFEPGYHDGGRYHREHRDHGGYYRGDREDRGGRGYRPDWDGYRR